MQTRFVSGSTAYDFEKFETKQRAQVRKPRLTVTRPNHKVKVRAKIAATLKLLATVAVLAGVVISMLYSRALLTELNAKISRQNALLDEYKSESTRLSAELESKISLRNVEDYATQTLGMYAVDKGQVTYVNLCDGDKIELTSESPKQTLLDRIRLSINNVQAYIQKQ